MNVKDFITKNNQKKFIIQIFNIEERNKEKDEER